MDDADILTLHPADEIGQLFHVEVDGEDFIHRLSDEDRILHLTMSP